jgi:diguanylate cyclase (GGDEF)-like protein
MSQTSPEDRVVLAVGMDPGSIAGFTVEIAEDLLGALAHLADGGIDAVLVSLDLPDATGADVVRSIRERAPDVPVIAVSAGGADPAEAIDAGASDVLPQGAGPELVERALRYAAAIRTMQAELHRRQVVDERTGLYNARGFEQLATHHLRLADRSKEPVILVFVRVEDPGQAQLDEAVAGAAEGLRAAVRDSDIVARVGVDAFCVLLTGDAAGAESLVLSRVVEAVATRNTLADEGRLSLSVASASYDPENPVALEELIAEAGRRMGPKPTP